MRYLDELVRNAMAELRFWLGYRRHDRRRQMRPRGAQG
jgi:hypothetical protein